MKQTLLVLAASCALVSNAGADSSSASARATASSCAIARPSVHATVKGS